MSASYLLVRSRGAIPLRQGQQGNPARRRVPLIEPAIRGPCLLHPCIAIFALSFPAVACQLLDGLLKVSCCSPFFDCYGHIAKTAPRGSLVLAALLEPPALPFPHESCFSGLALLQRGHPRQRNAQGKEEGLAVGRLGRGSQPQHHGHYHRRANAGSCSPWVPFLPLVGCPSDPVILHAATSPVRTLNSADEGSPVSSGITRESQRYPFGADSSRVRSWVSGWSRANFREGRFCGKFRR
jgi:hypothetical protein